MSKIYGADFSHHQGTVDWATVATELRRVNGGTSPGFAILRAGYSARHGKGGLWTDGQFLRNIRECEKYGIPMGAYFYCYDKSAAAAEITAEQVAALLKGHKFDYPIYYDVEYEPFNTGKDGSGRTRAQVKATNTAMISAALSKLEKLGYYAAAYCSRDFFLNYTNLSALSGFDKWEAAYTATDTDAVQNGLWQYSSTNALGIKGFGNKLDCDVCYRDYPGIMKAAGLNGYAKTTDTDTGNANDTDKTGNDTADSGTTLTQQIITVGPVSNGDAMQFLQLAEKLKLTERKLYVSKWV